MIPRIIFSLLLMYACAGKAQTPQTLLWRISGKGLPASYLYGTMHSGDKRIYFLGDSVYSTLGACQGYAMEIDPGDYVDTLISNMETEGLNISYKENIENNIVKRPAGYYSEQRKRLDSIFVRIRERYKDLSPREIARLEKVYRRREKNQMNTLLDLYLFDMAKKQNKVVAGIEDITDQTSIVDELGNSFDPDDFLKTQRKKYADLEEWMVDNYVKADLDKIHEFSKQGSTARHMTLFLYNRNNKMARRIDSLMHIRSTFCAVGAAHLPGDSGVIDLLRKRGFTVTPVFSSKKIEPGDIRISNTNTVMLNITDPDSNYVVHMPGKPTALTSITKKLVVKTYKELANEIMLMHGLYEDGNIDNNIENEVKEMKAFFSYYDIRLYDDEKIKRQDIDGYEMIFKNTLGYFKMHIFWNKGKTYMFAVGSKNRDSLKSSRCTAYLDSYTMFPDKKTSGSAMLSYTSADKAFSISLPSLPKKEFIKGDATVTNEDITLFSSLDVRKKINYLVMLKEPFRGYFAGLDSSLFDQAIVEMKKDFSQTAFLQETVLLDGLPALKTKIRGETGDGKKQVIYCVLALRGNRLYNLTARGLAISENEQQFDQFINSFHFLPYEETPFTQQAGGSGLFSANAPSPVYILPGKSDTKGLRTDYYTFDSSRTMTYGVTAIYLGKYFWAKDEKALLDAQSLIYFNDSNAVNNLLYPDSLLYKKTVQNGSLEGRELLLKDVRRNAYTRIRILHYADSAFILNLSGAKEMVTDDRANDFFSSFRFNTEQYRTDAFQSKTAILVKDLQSADENTRTRAAAVLSSGFSFPPQDLPLLLDALLYDYPAVKNNPSPVPGLLTLTIASHMNDEVTGFIKTHYTAQAGKREALRMELLNMLAAANTTTSYELLQQLLVNDPPASGDYEKLLSYAVRSPRKAAILFPSLVSRLADERMSPFIASLANILIDSNAISYSTIKGSEEDVIKLAKKALRQYQQSSTSFVFPHIEDIIRLLARNDKKQARELLNDYLAFQNNALTPVIIDAMVKNNIPVATSVYDEFARVPEQRVILYNELARNGRQSAFKGEFATQRSFADAYVSVFTSDEITESVPKYYDIAAIKDVFINGELCRFYIYKVTCQFKRSTEVFTAMVGPFSADVARSLAIPEGKEVYTLNRNKFDAGSIDTLFNAFVDKIKKMKR